MFLKFINYMLKYYLFEIIIVVSYS